jgi:hypothetical protein
MSLSYVLASYILRTPGGVLYAVLYAESGLSVQEASALITQPVEAAEPGPGQHSESAPGGVLYAVVKLIHYADRDRVQLLPPAV